MARRLRAAVLRKTGESLTVEELIVSPLVQGQVLVKLNYAGVCRSQIMEQRGERGEDKWLPHLLGHEGFGEVIEIGPKVTRCKVGDRVILSWIKGAGIEAINPTYLDENGLIVNSGKVTTFSNYSVVSENRIYAAPDGFEDEFLPLFGCALLTGGGMALKYGQVSNISKICILGFGGVGSAAALVLKGLGNKNIDIVDLAEEKLNVADYLGFERTSDSIEDFDQRYDLIIESSGTIEGIHKGFENLTDTGTLVFASHPKEGGSISLNPFELIKGKKIFGTWGGDVTPQMHISDIARLLKSSESDLSLLIGPTFSLSEINQALSYLDSGRPGRPLLKLNEV